MIYNQIKNVIRVFRFEGKYVDAEELHSGNVNNTYHLWYRAADGTQLEYVLQQINTYAFRHPEEVMDNIVRVTAHLRSAI